MYIHTYYNTTMFPIQLTTTSVPAVLQCSTVCAMHAAIHLVCAQHKWQVVRRQAHLVWDTQMAWSTSAKMNSSNLFVMMELPSANPKSEWSVNTVLSPMDRACTRASWQVIEKA